jgi:hypothetical protein
MGKGQPLLNENEIWFNGSEKKNEDHETFSFRRIEDEDFSFCETARKPYDLIVASTLIVIKNYVGDDINISSDGNSYGDSECDQEWKDAFKFCQKILGYGENFKIDENGLNKISKDSVESNIACEVYKKALRLAAIELHDLGAKATIDNLECYYLVKAKDSLKYDENKKKEN